MSDEVIIEEKVDQINVSETVDSIQITESNDIIEVHESVDSISVTETVDEIIISDTGIPGPKGDKGDPGDTTEEFSMNAGEDIISLKAVRRESNGLGYVAESSELTDAHTVIGIATQSVSAGGVFNYIARGELTDPALALVDGEVFVGPTGTVTQTPPNSGFVLKVGHAIGPNTIFVAIAQPITLS